MSGPWKIQGEEKDKFEKIFESLVPTAGKLSGDKVKPILMNSKLPIDVLGQVWELSDIDRDGFLDKDEFCVAMHLVYKALEKEPVPSVLPSDLIPPSKRKPTLPGAVPVLPPLSSIGSSPSATKTSAPSITTADALTSVLKPVSVSAPPQKSSLNKGVIPEVEYTRFSGIFLQKASDNYIAGSAARDIFVQSGLPQSVLAHVWNLCDQQQLGKLTQDQFVLAMHFISQKVKGIEVPSQITNEIQPQASRDSGFPDSGSFSDSSSSGIGDFSAVRELDSLNREIEDLRREKETLTTEIREKEQTIRVRGHEVQELQNTVDRQSTALSQLESDKAESHTRLDELDQQQLKLDGMLADIRSKVQEETRTIASLHSQIKSQELAITQREEEFSRTKNELESLKNEESQLQQTFEIGKQQLQSITKQANDAQNEIEKVQEQIKSLTEQQKTVSSNIAQYDKAVSALKSEAEASAVHTPEIDSSSGNNLFEKADGNLFEDPFKQSDPFASESSFKTDPFADTGNFNSTVATTTFQASSTTNSVGFTSETSSNDAFGGVDPFSEKNDPFASNNKPFESGFASDPFAGPDPFASSPPKATPAPETKKSTKKVADMFSSNFFDQDNSVSLFNDTEPTAKPSNEDSTDLWAAFGGTAEPADNATSGEDLFGKDAFVVNTASSKKDPFSNIAPKPSANKPMGDFKNMTEEAQLAWAAEQSRIAEEERKEKLRIQEQMDLELAISLSKQS